MKQSILASAFILSAAIAGPRELAQTDPPIIAVLEDSQRSREETRPVVHVLFTKSDSGWVALTDQERFDQAEIPPTMNWIMTFNEKKLGELTLDANWPEIRYAWTFPRDMITDVPEGLDLPLIRNTERAFSGWNRTPSFRPIILVDNHEFDDPEDWHEITIDSESSVRELIFPVFHQVADSISLGIDYHGNPLGMIVVSPGDLKVVAGYENNTGEVIVAVRINPSVGGGGGGLWQDEDWSVHWFLLKEEPVLLGKWFEYIDAGDYDGDGSSELLFWYSAYNCDGYSLFSNNFKHRVDYWWGYH